ncbi:hypothetical protein QJS66_08905 [Kocuria rhizophila]|nr:hypothetical protein QJS66_08905 [Kocuria rhizophila]
MVQLNYGLKSPVWRSREPRLGGPDRGRGHGRGLVRVRRGQGSGGCPSQHRAGDRSC